MTRHTIASALAFAKAWRDAGHCIVPREITPPCDELGDDVHDAYLAVVFHDLSRLDTITERVCRLQTAIEANLPMIDYCRSRHEEDAAARIERMVNVLRKWADELVGATETERAA
jgi:hypothetical protein